METLDPQTSEPVTVSLTEEELRRSPEERRLREHEDGIQHGIDDDPENDASKGAGLGAAGGALVGGAAGAMLGPAERCWARESGRRRARWRAASLSPPWTR